MIDPGLQDKVVLITGANHGIGAVTAKAFAAQGAKVFITYFRGETRFSADELAEAQAAGAGGPALYAAKQQQSGEQIVAEIMAAGGTAVAHAADLANVNNTPLLFDQCEAKLGPVDVLVCNHTHCVMETFDPATVTSQGFPIGFISAVEADRHFAINARAYALLMAEYTQRYLARQANWGRIVLISTDAAHAHTANVHYAASKHAIESYGRSAAIELGQYGITVNIIAPGPIQTGYIEPEAEAHIAANTPLRRIGQPEHLADVIVFMASEQARWVTGQLIYVGGGWRMGQ
ncbi:MAG: SDR family oxidoreductase [Ardenticatenaceae bacterium]|nr:SDR family oxidoreductase [Ardenticatenaceae bacterium]